MAYIYDYYFSLFSSTADSSFTMMAGIFLLLWSSSRSILTSVHGFVSPTHQLSRCNAKTNSILRTFATIDNSTTTDSASTTTSSESDDDNDNIALLRAERGERKRQKKAAAAKRRSKFIGMAKAVDRGQFKTTYRPGGSTGVSFVAKSGLPVHETFTVLGIESSCDDTGAAVVRSDGVILGESLASQAEIHEEWGGDRSGTRQVGPRGEHRSGTPGADCVTNKSGIL